MKRLFVAATLVLVASGSARAACPYDGLPNKGACESIDAYLMPGLVVLGYWPSSDAGRGPWLGGGVEVVPFLWSHNTNRFGPGQGKLLFDVGVLGSDTAGTGKMLLYRGGAELSFERNASRTFGIPFFGFFFGGLNERAIDHHSFVEATAGLHLLYLKNVIITLEAGYLFPFDRVDDLAGLRGTLAVNFTLW